MKAVKNMKDKMLKAGSLLAVMAGSLVLSASVFTSCTREYPVGIGPKGVGKSKVTFVISVPTSSAPSTRAITEGGAADNRVDNVTFLLFDTNSGLYAGYAKATAIAPGALANQKTFTVTLPDGAYNTLVLANADDILARFVDAGLATSGSPLTDILDANAAALQAHPMSYFQTGLTNTLASGTAWNADPSSGAFLPFPMAAHFDIPADRSSLGTIFLTRMLAKINLTFGSPDVSSKLTLKDIQLCNYNRTGALVQPVITGALSVFNAAQLNIPASPNPEGGTANALDYAGAIDAVNNQCVDEIFLNEVMAQSSWDNAAGTAWQNAPCLLVKGTLASTGADRWFRINLRLANPDAANAVQHVNIMRNFRYTINITAVDGNGYATADEAYNSFPEGMTTTIMAIDESGMNDITYNGQYQLTVDKSDFLFLDAAGNQTVKIFTDYSGGWAIASVSGSWITAPATAVTGPGNITTPTTITCSANTGTTARTGTFVITAGNLRKTITVVQLPPVGSITDSAVPAGFMPYVGAFWKADQTGERLIRMVRTTSTTDQPSTADGAWTATVLVGKDWIVLDKAMTSDTHVGWLPGGDDNPANGNDAGFDAGHQVVSALTTVSGRLRPTIDPAYQPGDENIYFRVGLNSKYPATAAAPARYGLVLLTYANNTKLQRIWIRQGEGADYLMRTSDASNGGFVSSTRPAAVPFSPYNLTAPAPLNRAVSINGTTTDPSGAPAAVFTQYPTQAGAIFQWANDVNPRCAYVPAGMDAQVAALWQSSSSTSAKYWANSDGSLALGATNETCPDGYRRPTDGTISTQVISSGNLPVDQMALSEMRQSLYLSPANSTTSSIGNSVYGYYADGFFDRRMIGASSTGTAVSAVSTANNSVAYVGRLFFNSSSNSYASIFFPASGYRSGSSAGALVNSGAIGYYWASSKPNGARGMSLYFEPAVAYQQYGYDATNGFSVRCVKDVPPVFPDPGTVADTPPSGFIPFVGAFWKANQTGERLIRMATTTADAGAWTAMVLVGADWITVDNTMTSDVNVGWRTDVTPTETSVANGNDAGFDAAHPVGGKSWVRGTANPSIYFRIGLKSALPAGSAPRYGLVLVTYANNTKNQRIWVRQGEGDDYVPGLSSGTKWSPYNLGNANNFMNYPTQAGWFYQWCNTPTPWHPIDPPGTTPSGWNSASSGSFNLGSISPSGYTLPTGGGGSNIASLLTANVIGGYYADGWFDRRQIVQSVTYGALDSSYGNSQPGPPYDKTAVCSNASNPSDPQNANVAYIGTLFFSATNNSSLFFPNAGYRFGQSDTNGLGGYSPPGALWLAGRIGSYWSSNEYDDWGAGDNTAYNLSLDMIGNGMSVGGTWVNMATAGSGYGTRNFAYPIRCVHQ